MRSVHSQADERGARAPSPESASLDDHAATLYDVGCALRRAGYVFVAPTPETQRRVIARDPRRLARDLRDIFGWNRLVDRATAVEGLSRRLFERCLDAKLFESVEPAGGAAPEPRWKSRVRFSTLTEPTREHLFVHSSFPTTDVDSVFFGPDSYRFASLLLRTVTHARRAVDLGCGTGVGGLVLTGRVEQVVLSDVNLAALQHAAVNVALAGAHDAASLCRSDLLAEIEDGFDLVVANPPYILDDAGRLYRNGGGARGIDLAVRIVEQSLMRLPGGGRLILYTGAPIEDGRNVLIDRLRPLAASRPASWKWQELDPDVFGEELERDAYRDVERLALIALDVTVE